MSIENNILRDSKNSSIIVLIWTYNPDIDRLKLVLNNIKKYDIIIIDNGSKNLSQIVSIATTAGTKIIEIEYNSGVHALNIGIEYAINGDYKYMLILDQDTVLHNDAIDIMVYILKKVPNVAAVRIRSINEKFKKEIDFLHLVAFSGSMINLDIIRRYKINVREDFFLDQADFDFFYKFIQYGYYVVTIGKKLMDHKIGSNLCIKSKIIFIHRCINQYESPLRVYYIIRNSTVLLLEHKMDIKSYIIQLIGFIFKLIHVNGIFITLKVIGLGFIHGITKRLGIIEPAIIYK